MLTDRPTSCELAYKYMLKYKWEPGKGLGRSGDGCRFPVVVGRGDFKGISGDLDSGSEALFGYLDKWASVVHGGSEPHEKTDDPIDGSDEISQVLTVFEEDGGDGLEGKRGELSMRLMELDAKIGGYKLKCLIDTGSQVTCIAEATYLNVRVGLNIPVIPIVPIQIQGATRARSNKVDRAALIPITIGELVVETPCLIIKGLIKEVILGIDWLEQKEAKVVCGPERLIKFQHLGTTQQIEVGRNFVRGNYKGLAIGSGGREQVTVLNMSITGEKLNNIDTRPKQESRGAISDFIRSLQESNSSLADGLEGVLMENRSVFSDRPGLTHKYRHRIVMGNEEPFMKRSYNVPFAYRSKIEAKLLEMEQLGIIGRDGTPYCSPLTCTIKKDGSVRILLDARELNKRMLGDVEAPPLVSDILQSFNGVKFISLIDLNNAYYQIPLHPESVKYTGFTFMGKSYTYRVLPQGLKTSVGSFSRAMDVILGAEVRSFCANYLDDLVVFSKDDDISVHYKHLGTVLSLLKGAGMTCRLSKCQFIRMEVSLLGHIVSPSGVRMDPDKIAAIKEFPAPRSVKQLRAFLGLVNYYRRFISKYSYLTTPLCRLLQKDSIWKWSNKEEEQFERIKEAFLGCIMLIHPDPSKPYFLQTDSSKIGIAGCLYQTNEEGDEQVIGFCSKGLTCSEQQWTVSEQELWAVVYGLKKFETYLRGAVTIIRTDHKSLSFINNWNLYSARVTRWIMYMQQFDYTVEYVKGKDNVVPDVLSRYARGAGDVQEARKLYPQIAMFIIPKTKRIVSKLKNIARLQEGDLELRKVRDKLAKEPGSSVQAPNGDFVIEDGRIMHKTTKGERCTVVVPTGIREELIQSIHEETGHFGEARIKRLITDRFYIPNLSQILRQILKSCDLCQKAKHVNRSTVGACKAVLTKDVGEIVMVDWFGPLPKSRFGMQYVLVIQDAFSKYVQLYPTRIASTQTAIRCVCDYYETIQFKTIVSDNGSQFTSKLWYETLNKMGVRISHTTVRNPRPNCTERVNKELGRLMRTYCHRSHRSWGLILKNIETCYNNTIHASTGYTPIEILSGKRPVLAIDSWDPTREREEPLLNVEAVRDEVRQNLQKMAQWRAEQYNRRHNIEYYQIGELVKVRKCNYSRKADKVCKKFTLLYEGPYRVGGVPYANAYLLVDPKDPTLVKGTYNAVHLSKYYV